MKSVSSLTQISLAKALLLSGLMAIASTAIAADSREDIEYRIKKVGRLNIVEAPKMAAATATATAGADAAPDGEALYTAKCAACHASGVLSAPIVGNVDHWSARVAQGNDALYSHAIDGFNGMPPRGGAVDLDDAAIKAIVDFMVSKSQ